MNKIYTIIRTGDGASIERISKEILVQRLNINYYGSKVRIFTAGDLMAQRTHDLMELEGIFIIEGDLVSPISKTVVKEWSL